jgi:hypothetical protein
MRWDGAACDAAWGSVAVAHVSDDAVAGVRRDRPRLGDVANPCIPFIGRLVVPLA